MRWRRHRRRGGAEWRRRGASPGARRFARNGEVVFAERLKLHHPVIERAVDGPRVGKLLARLLPEDVVEGQGAAVMDRSKALRRLFFRFDSQAPAAALNREAHQALAAIRAPAPVRREIRRNPRGETGKVMIIQQVGDSVADGEVIQVSGQSLALCIPGIEAHLGG